VLITVLWIVLVLSLVSFSLASAVRVEVRTTQDGFDAQRALFMATGAAEVIYDYVSKERDIPADAPFRLENAEYVFPFDSGEARAHLEFASGRIDLNFASDRLLASMFDSTGLTEEQRNRLVDSILDWRDSDDVPHLYGAEAGDYPENSPGRARQPRNAAFQSVEELLLVRNMTPDIFYGGLSVDPANGDYRRVAAVRDLVTVQSGKEGINPNDAPRDVLTLLPDMTEAVADRIIEERTKARFADAGDFAQRLPDIARGEMTPYFDFGAQLPDTIVATGTVAGSGVSRSVRLLFKRERKIQVLSPVPPVLWRWVEEIQFDRWRF
jgi:general secretion pathway protein K